MTKQSSEVVSKTTTIGLRTKDFVLLAADKRATAGVYIAHKKVEKIHSITDYMAMTISGLVADAQYLVDEARVAAKYYELSNSMKPAVRSIATYLANLISRHLRESPYVVQLIVGGYDDSPRLYYIDLFGSISEESYVATGSGSPIAMGVLERNYKEDLSVDEAKDVAIAAVKAAIGRDIYSGEGIDVVIISKEGLKKETIHLKT